MAALHLHLLGGSAMRYIAEFADWLGLLEPEEAFLLLMPFIVAAAGLSQYWLQRREPARPKAASRQPTA
jgi:hypothetical protein